MKRTAVLCLFVAVCATAPAIAGTISSSLDIELEIVGSIDSAEPQSAQQVLVDAINPDNGDFAIEGLAFGDENSPIWRATDVSLSGNADPFVNLDFTITNLSSSPADITVSAVVPILGSFPGPNVLFGELAFDVVDTGGTAGIATLSSINLGDPIFTGTVDGVGALPIAAGSFTVSGGTGTLTVGPTTNTDPAFGSATTSIGIDIAFTLSPGDSAVIDSFFSLEPIPEPAAATSAMLGLVLVLSVSRRR